MTATNNPIFSKTLIKQALEKNHKILLNHTTQKLLPDYIGFDGQVFYLRKYAGK